MAPISSVLDSSRKLRKLSVSVTSELVSDFQHSFVRNAEILSIHSVKRESGRLATALETIENRQIHIELIDFENPSPNEYFQLIQGWAAMKRSVGSLITFELGTDEIGEGILELLRARNERTESTDRCVTVLQSNSTILEVFYCGINIENSSELLLTAMIMEA
ncbi:hypothetical protein B9Z55_007037 [Caenorhabditis nigoni]|uniref:F-box associated domain-containing protein n=1 Tax=Caenorhabditis nigoni TaxID=1611254 RepID=A0A2G5V7X1_9PELO|nr:hypothetical protein B9Z55_007037 [Caenorhabditis nigoni]